MRPAPSAPVSILATRPLTAKQVESLRNLSPRVQLEHRMLAPSQPVAQVLKPDTEVLLATFPPRSAAEFPGLRWFQSSSAGIDRVVPTPLWQSAVRITTTSGLHAITVGEYTLGMMIALARDFRGFLTCQRQACWPQQPPPYEQFPGRDLRGATVLVVGYGSIGRQVARLAGALGMRVIALKRDPSLRPDRGFVFAGTGDPAGELPERIVGPDQLLAVLPEADFVVLAAPFTAATRHLLGAREFGAMRRDAILINVARGELVDEDAMQAALAEKRIAAAGLDVFAAEPLPPESPLWRLDNVIISPHVAGCSPRYDDYVFEIFAANLRRYLAGEPLWNEVDRQLGY